MTVAELIAVLCTCEPQAQVAIIDNIGVYALRGVQQPPDRDVVLLWHISDAHQTPREAGIAGGMYELSDAQMVRRIRKLRGAR